MYLGSKVKSAQVTICQVIMDEIIQKCNINVNRNEIQLSNSINSCTSKHFVKPLSMVENKTNTDKNQ